MHIDTNAYYVCFTKKVGVEERDKGATEDAPCFFPTGKLELHYTVLQEIKTAKEEKQIESYIIEQEKRVEQRNNVYRKKREEAEQLAMEEMCRHIDYSAILAQAKKSAETDDDSEF